MAQKKEKSTGDTGQIVTGSGLVAKRQRQRKHLKYIVLGGVMFAAVAALAWVNYQERRTTQKINSELSAASHFVRENDSSQALAHAKKALEQDPNNVDAILAVANLTLKEDPEEAKQYFARALNIYKQENNPDTDGKTAINYWAAAGLAEQAGLVEDAIKYYKKVVQAADPDDPYHQDLVKRSKTAIERLK